MDQVLRQAFLRPASKVMRRSLLRYWIFGICLFFGGESFAQFDLALRKTLGPGQSDTVSYGETVTFRITIFNQGTLPAYNILTLDYLPAGMTFSAAQNAGWFNFGAGPAWFIPGPLAPGASVSKDIKLVVSAQAVPGFLNNYAEITSADDDTNSGNTPPTDIDSTPNAFLFDDPGGQPGSPADNVITGNGTGAPGSSDPATDEDDHDGEAVVLYDPSLTIGNLVWHDLGNDGIFNNNDYGLEDVEVILYDAGPDTLAGTADDLAIGSMLTNGFGEYLFTGLPAGFYFVKLSGEGVPANFVSSTGGGPYDMTGSGTYEPGIVGDVNEADHGTQMNTMVMSGMFELQYETEPTDDGDGDWNTNLTADFGLYEPQPLPTLSIGNLVFTDLENDGIFNNNDFGLEDVEVILYDAGPDTLAGTADDLAIGSMLTNGFGEYLFTGLPAGFYFVKLSGEGVPANFVSSTGGGPYDISGAGPFEPGSEGGVNNADHGSQSQSMVTSGVVQLTIDGEPVDDGDTDPNTNLTIDFGLYEPLPSFDLALRLELLTHAVIAPGDSATLKVSIFNQAEEPAQSVLLTIRNPTGSVWDDPATSYLNDTTAAVMLSVQNGLLPSGGLLPGEMVMLPLNLYILPGFTGDALTVFAEISNATDGNGQIPQDADSTPDDDFTNDIIGGDNVINNANGDEDDHDYAYLPIGQAFDLGLEKSLAPGQPASVNLGGEVQYFIKITNQGDFPVANVQVYDFIPAGMILSLNDPNWTSISPDTAAYIFAGPIAPGAADSVAIFLKMQYGASGAVLSNFAEIQAVTDASGNVIPDNDSTPANSQTGEDDQGEATAGLLPHDPTGWIYCDKTGKVIPGGTISVTGPNGIPNDQVIIIEDGSNGYYEFFTDGTPGVYTVSYSHPGGYPLSVNCLPGVGPFDPTGMSDPLTLGVDTAGMYLADTACASNPYYLEFDLAPGDPYIFLNNIPVQCAAISSVVSVDANHNDTWDAADTPIAGATVYRYDCTNPGVPVDSVLSDAQGRYTFDGLVPGDYSVGFSIPGGYRMVTGGPINSFGFSNCFTLAWGDLDTSKFICIFECPAVDAGADVTICAGDTTQLQATLPYGSGSFNWTPAASLNDSTIANPLANPSAATTYTVAYDDGFGCASTDSLTVFVTTSTPFLTYTPFTDSTVECGAPVPFDAPQFADACDSTLTVTLDSVITAQPCGYILERNWTATNNQGNSAGFTQTITVTDTTPPAMTAWHLFFGAILHGDTLYADCTQIPSLDSLGFSAVDLCSATTVNFTENVTQGNCDVEGFVELRHCGWTATDACGNLDSLFFTVIVRDTTPPALIGVPADVTVECFNIPDTAVVTASDLCDTLVNLTFDETTIPAFSGCDSLIIRTWSAIDDCGNFAVASQTITVIDTTPPAMFASHAFFGTISHGDTLYADCTQIPSLDSLGFSAFDLCSATTVNFTETVMQGDCDVDGYIEWRYCGWTATDACGNMDSLFFTVVVQDTTPPVMSASHAFFGTISHGDTLYADCTQIPSLDSLGFSAYDLCSATTVNFTETVMQGDCDVDGYLEWRYCGWTATDACGNLDSLFFTVIVRDTTPPVLNGVPADVTVECFNIPDTAMVTASDLCDALVDLSFDETIILALSGCDSLVVRTWKAVDDCGNFAVASQTITVTDTTPPVMFATHVFFGTINDGDTLYADCTQIPSLDSLGFSAYDLCSATTVTFTENVMPGDCNVEGYFELRHCGWTATDACGNTDSLFFTVIVWDTLPPVLSAYPTDTTYTCPEDIPAAPTLTAADNCDTSVAVVFVETTTGSPTGCSFGITRTWTATDDCGNMTIAKQTILVNDSIPPVLSAYPTDTAYTCPADVPVAPTLTATDNCDTSVAVIFVETTTGDLASCDFEITRTWTATDDCGNMTIAKQTILVNDSIPPVLSAYPTDTAYTCPADVPAAPVLTATDNCDTSVAVVFVETTTGSPTGCSFGITRTWTATDDCGNTAIATQIIVVNDSIPPVLSAYPTDTTYTCPADVPVAPVLTAADNCTPSVAVVFVETTTGNPAGCSFEITRTWTAADDCGNTVIATQTILVNDTVPPVFSSTPASLTLSCETPVPPAPVLTATDNCDPDVEVDFTESYFGDPASGCHLVTRIWTATDDCGNTATVSQFIMVTDFTPPTLHDVPPNQTVSCENIPGNNVTATDNCDSNVPVAITETVTADVNGCISQIKRTWTAADDCGNIAFATRTFFVTNDDAPVITITNPAMAGVSDGDTLYLECQQIIGLTANDVSATADCCGAPTVTFHEFISATGDCQAFGYLQVMTCGWVATDCCGNTDSLFFTVFVIDNTAPALLGVPNDTTLVCGDAVPAPAIVQGLDNCDNNVMVSFSADTTSSGGGVQIIRTWTAVDACGNAVSDMQVITIAGDLAPNIFNVPANTTVYDPANVPPPPSNIVLSDDCDPSPQLFFNEEKIGSGDCCYTLVRTWTAVDFSGNSNSSTQIITVADTVAPMISGIPADLTVACDWVEAVAPSVSVSDNCTANPALAVSLDTAFASCGFTITRTWTAADECGNATSASQIITVTDTEAPVLSGIPADLPLACGDPVPALPTVTASDNCDGSVTVVFTETQQGSGCSYQLIRTWTAGDACGNLVSASQTITVNDDSTPPVLAGVPPDVTVECTNIPAPAAVTATDNCSSATVTMSEITGGGCPQIITRTWTATDDCGNSISASQTITVNDTQPPVLSGVPADLTVSCSAGVPVAATLTATDNCTASVPVVFGETMTGSGCSFVVTRTWTATDDCGNSVVHTQTITVNDTEAPVLTNTPADVTVTCDAIPQPANVTASDNCDDNLTILFDETTYGSGCASTVERTWTATDDCGNGTSFTQIITVYDTEAPVLANTPADVTVACDAVPQPANVTASDNCDDNVTLIFDETTNGSGCAYTIERTWTATDDCGNGTSFTQIITVEDNMAPAFAFTPADVTVDCGETVPAFGDPIVEDDCSGVTLTAVTDSIATVGGYGLTRTWTATDSCGNSASAAQTISVTTGGAPVLHGVPNDTTIILASGGVVPGPANVTATDGCDSTATLPVIFDENKTPNGCDTIIVRAWSATGSGGLTVSDTQTITVVVMLQIAASTTPDTCGLGVGTASLTPSAYTFAWSDGGSGATRSGLSAGAYTVTASSGSCFDTLQVVVGNVCPCDQAVVNSVSITHPTCGNYDGSVTIDLAQDEADYKFLWLPMFGTPNADGNIRTDLPSGHYFVYIVLKSDNSCVEKLEFDLLDDCPKCAPFLPVNFIEVDVISSPSKVCIPVPFGLSMHYGLQMNGSSYGGTLEPCDPQTVVNYSYSLAYGFGLAGPYLASWQHDGATLNTQIFDMDELAAAMNAVDPAGMWFNNSTSSGIASANTTGNYGEMTLKHIATGDAAVVQPQLNDIPGGTLLTLSSGSNTLVFVDSNSDCADTLVVNVTVQLAPPDEIFAEKLAIVSGNCMVVDLGYCLGIPFAELGDYKFEVNGQAYGGSFGVCEFFENHFYSYAALPGLGQAGPYEVGWAVNGQVFSAGFQNIAELPGLMNGWDAGGNWNLDAASLSLTGGRAGTVYSPLKIRQLNTGVVATLELNSSTAPGSAYLELPDGFNTIVAIRLAGQIRDTLAALVACVTPDYFETTIGVNESDTLLLNLDELAGNVAKVSNVSAAESNPAASFGLIEGTPAIHVQGLKAGQSKACIVLCDEFGICDTTFIHVTVRGVEQSVLQPDTLRADFETAVTGWVLDNDLIIGKIESVEIVRNADHGNAVLNEDFTVTYTPFGGYCNDFGEARPDKFFYEVCLEDGRCYTTVAYVEVACEKLKIVSGFSPNGDGVNDFFRIEGLKRYPDHQLSIFNRWGGLVFKTRNYLNDWGGSWGSNNLPDGTYFYLLDDGEGKQFSGFVEIRR